MKMPEVADLVGFYGIWVLDGESLGCFVPSKINILDFLANQSFFIILSHLKNVQCVLCRLTRLTKSHIHDICVGTGGLAPPTFFCNFIHSKDLFFLLLAS